MLKIITPVAAESFLILGYAVFAVAEGWFASCYDCVFDVSRMVKGEYGW